MPGSTRGPRRPPGGAAAGALSESAVGLSGGAAAGVAASESAVGLSGGAAAGALSGRRFPVELRGLGATRGLAESVAAVLRPGDVIGLDGDLGAGKTTFVRFLARALGVTTPVTSPTFTLANIYEAPGGPAATAPPLLIHHIDAYRLDGDADAEDLALGELLDSGGIVVVEWAERLTLPPDRLDLHFAYPPEPTPADAAEPAEPAAEPAASGAAPAAASVALHVDPPAADLRVVTITPHGPGWQARRPCPLWLSDAGRGTQVMQKS